jgi:hypothetical protein
MTREKGGTRETLALPPFFCSFGFPGSRSAPHYASSEQHGGQPRTAVTSRASLKDGKELPSRFALSTDVEQNSCMASLPFPAPPREKRHSRYDTL